jgi:hypothetical protein
MVGGLFRLMIRRERTLEVYGRLKPAVNPYYRLALFLAYFTARYVPLAFVLGCA